MSLLKAENLSKTYQIGDINIKALIEINLQISKGEFISIVGKSGSGKSTLMHILGLLDTPSSGKLYLNDQDVSSLSQINLARIRNREVGFVFQQFNLLPRVSCIENVMLPLQYSDTPKKEWKNKAIDELIKVGLKDRLYNKSNELSGGQKQRVAIARALVTKPSVIFADEPTGNLDTKTGEEIEKLLTELNEEGKTIVLVTHDEDLASIANRRITLKDGEIVNV